MEFKKNLMIVIVALIALALLLSCEKKVEDKAPTDSGNGAGAIDSLPTAEVDSSLVDANAVASDLNPDEVGTGVSDLEKDLSNW